MKSDTYQKEGWFVLEDESRVFGHGTENRETDIVNNKNKNKTADSDHSDKEDMTKADIDEATGDFLDYVDELIQNEPEPSEEEVRSGIDKILAKAYPEEKEEAPVISVENGKKKKATVKKVLLLVAVIAVLAVVSICAMGDYHNISTENGFVTYAKNAIQITFFGESEEEYITVDTLLNDLKTHGYEDIMFPEAFLFDTECRISVPNYSAVDEIEQVDFYVYHNGNEYSFCINKKDYTQISNFPDLDNAQTVVVDGMNIYIFDCGRDSSAIEFFNGKYHYYISSYIPYTEMVSFAETIK